MALIDELRQALQVVDGALDHIADGTTRNNARAWLDRARGHVETLSSPPADAAEQAEPFVPGSSEDPARGGTPDAEVKDPGPAVEAAEQIEPPAATPVPPAFAPGSSEDPARGGTPEPPAGQVPSLGETPVSPPPVPPPPGS